MNTKEKIYLTLTDKLSAQFLDIKDESAGHLTHREAKTSGGGHYHITVVSDCFNGKTLLARHRLVYAILKEELREKIHALSLRAYTPDEWNKISLSIGASPEEIKAT